MFRRAAGRTGRAARGRVWGAAALVLALLGRPGHLAAERLSYVIGDSVPDSTHMWAAQGVLRQADAVSSPGWILPLRIEQGQSILQDLDRQGRLFAGIGIDGRVVDSGYGEEDGRLWSPNLSFSERTKLLQVADGMSDTTSFDVFNRQAGNLGVTIYADLGAPFPVSLVEFAPLLQGAHADRFVRGYELYASDGSAANRDAEGNPIYALLSAVPTNVRPAVVDSSFRPQHIRYLRLRITKEGPFEIDRLDIRGSGYLGHASFLSNVIDLGDLANLGAVEWQGDADEGASFQVQTRVGRDATALRYYRINDLGMEEELPGSTDAGNKAAWLALAPEMRGAGGVDDDQNWSLWSPPYERSGDRLMAVGTRRYVQVRVVMGNESPLRRARVDHVRFAYCSPPLARAVHGEVSPRRGVDLGATSVLTYTLTPTLQGGSDLGFDVVEITTPVRSRVLGVSVAGRALADAEYQVESEDRLLTVRLLGEENQVRSSADVVAIALQTTALSYATVLPGRVMASWQPDDLPQDVEEVRPGDLTVHGSLSSLGRVIDRVVVTPNPFTPNGDGINDRAQMSFQVFQVVDLVPLSLEILDLDGRPRRTSFAGLPPQVRSGEFVVAWDGTDDAGQRVPPGIYVVRASVAGDRERFSTLNVVSVVY